MIVKSYNGNFYPSEKGKVMIVEEITGANFFRLLPFIAGRKCAKFSLWRVDSQDCEKYLLHLLNHIAETGKLFVCTENANILCLLAFQELAWDTNYFNYKCGKVESIICTDSISEEKVEESLALLIAHFHNYLKNEGFRHCMADISSWDAFIASTLQQNDFRYILSWGDCFRDSIEPRRLPKDYKIGPIKESELEYIQNLSEDYFNGGRFYLDRNFNRKAIDALYAGLVMNSYNDPKTEILVLRRGTDPIGAFLCKEIEYHFVKPYYVRSLRLLVFDKRKSVPGLATEFISDVANVLYEKLKCNLVVSGLETHNLPSLIIHTRGGYKLNYTHNAYHWWSKDTH